MRPVTSAASVSAFLAGLRALGLDADAVARAGGVDEERLGEPFAAYPTEVFARLWEAAADQDDEPTLPLRAGLAVPFGSFGLLDYLVASTPTLGAGVEALARFFRLATTSLRLVVERDGGTVGVRVETVPPHVTAAEEWSLAVFVGRFGLVGEGAVRDVQLANGALAPAEEASEILGVPVRGGAAQYGLRLDAGVWARPMRAADPALHTTLSALASRSDVRVYEASPTTYAVRTRLAEAVRSGRFSVREVAAELGLSARTLQRRLRAEGTSFREVLDAHRREEASRLVEQGGRSLSEVADALGYAEQSAFSRAFRRWTGHPPSATS